VRMALLIERYNLAIKNCGTAELCQCLSNG
jgi:hypothetical protein